MKWDRSMLALLITVLSAAVSAQDATTRAQRLAANCTTCHGPAGVAAGAGIARLAGQSKDAILKKFQAFKDGSAPATVMHQIAKGYDAEQIALIAEFFSRQSTASPK
jgi:sulfide dehydrogenase cytochrome subunit